MHRTLPKQLPREAELLSQSPELDRAEVQVRDLEDSSLDLELGKYETVSSMKRCQIARRTKRKPRSQGESAALRGFREEAKGEQLAECLIELLGSGWAEFL